MQAKHCHQGLRARSRFFGLEPIDLLLLFPPLYVGAVLFGAPLVGVATTLTLAVALRALKLGRLPGTSLDLLMYLVINDHCPVLGTDTGPLAREAFACSPKPSRTTHAAA